jgi:membrane associated rhomboid family serine protease
MEPEAPSPAPVEAEGVCYRHPGRDAGVRCVRCERYICPDCMRPAAVGFQCPECVSEGARTVRTPRTVYGGRVAAGGTPVVTYSLIAICVVIFLATANGPASFGLSTSVSQRFSDFALIPVYVADKHEYYRLLSSMFLHFNIIHIGFNMYALFIVGPPLEAVLGRTRYLALYLVAGLGGAAASYAFGSPFETAAGASAAIFGLFGAFFIITRHQRRDPRGILVLIAINLVLSFTITGIDYHAHLGGLFVGAAVAAIFAYAPRGPQRTLLQVSGVVAVALIIIGVTVVRTHTLSHDYPLQPPPAAASYDARAAVMSSATSAALPPIR